jgi:chaperone modulatory protein CbpM
MVKEPTDALHGDLLDESVELTFAELCRACRIPAERMAELIDFGVAEPLGRDPGRWRFRAVTVRRVHCALRLQADLGVNPAGAALVLDLLDELDYLRRRVKRLEG